MAALARFLLSARRKPGRHASTRPRSVGLAARTAGGRAARSTVNGVALFCLGLCLTGLALATSSCAAAADIGDGSGGTPPVPSADAIAFVPSETLLLEPGDVGELAVQVSPAGFHSVSFSLVANPSDSAFDGFLDAATVVTDENGFATNSLQAPTSSAVFLVRASVNDTVVANRTVSVSTEGFATLVATPAYSGVREVDAWSAAASMGVSCSDLDSIWADGALEAEGDSDEVTLSGVPVGSDVALVVRAGSYVGGCVTVTNLGPGEVRELEVPVTDRPLQLTGVSISLALDIEERTESFVELLSQASARGATDYAEGYGEDADVLFADCAAAINDDEDLQAFLERAEQYGYADILRAQLPTATALREAVLAELVTAATAVDGPNVWMLSAELDGSSSALVLTSAAGVPASKSGFLGSSLLSVVREPADRLVLGADLEFQATRWLGAIAEEREDSDPFEHLEMVVDCEGLAALWIEAGAGDLYSDCDETCAAALCRDGLELGWDRARSTAKELTTLRIGISGDATIDDEAAPVGLDGDWVGSIDDSALSVAGAARTPAQGDGIP